MDYLNDFIAWMTKNGCEPANPSDIISDDVRRYFQLASDKKGVKKATYSLNQTDGFAYGFVMNMRTGEKFSYTSKTETSWTPEQLEAHRKRIAGIKQAQEEEDRKSKEEAAIKANEIWDKAAEEGTHQYLEKKKIALNGARITASGDVLVPVRIGGKITSLQIIDKLGDKKFLLGGEIKGGYFALQKHHQDKKEIIITEGYATASTIYDATGIITVCAFNAKNLRPVAEIIRAKCPEARIIFAADNDWEKFEAKKSKHNTGIHEAEQAAAAIGGAVVLPCPRMQKATDFNDIFCLEGAEAVKKIFDSIHKPDDVPEHIEDVPIDAEELTMDRDDVPEYVTEGYDNIAVPNKGELYKNTKEREAAQIKLFNEEMFNFRVLGYDRSTFYYYPFEAKQIIELTPNGHNIQNLLQLDTLQNWQKNFGGENVTPSKIALMAANGMMDCARKKGVFVEDDRVRGGGCWLDEGRVVMNCGDKLYVDRVPTDMSKLETKFTYVAAAKLVHPAKTPLDDISARKLQQICESATWDNPLSGTLLAGWIVIAPFGAALSFRPHIWLTGEAESGKSTILNKILKPSLGKLALCLDGGTTEPALRSTMGYNARPLVYDEAEPSQSMMGVLDLLRKSSYGSDLTKYGQKVFKVRFCACLSAINPPVNKTADESRISFLHLKKNRKSTAMQDYAELLNMIDETITDGFSERLLARTLAHVDILLANIKTFQQAMRKTTGGARAAEQIGTIMAGVYMLNSTSLIKDDHALAIVSKYRWDEHTIIDQAGDPTRLIQWIIGSLIRDNDNHDITIGELVYDVLNKSNQAKETADKLLRHYGILVRDGRVYIANSSQNLARLLKGTEWVTRWHRTLSDIEGAEKHKIVYFSAGTKTSAVSLPSTIFTETDADEELKVEEQNGEEMDIW